MECMEEHGVTEENIKEMDEAEEPNGNYSCFFGCIMLKDGTVSILVEYFIQIECTS